MRRTSSRSPLTLRVALLMLVMALFAAACSSGGGESAEDDSDGLGAREPTEDDAGPPQRGGKVVFGLEAETADGWCLAEGQLAISGIQVARSIYDTLTVPNENGEFEPFLAESVEPNEDATVWTIKLREGIKFHDGTDLTADVVKNNLDAYRGQYPPRNSLLFLFVLQDIQETSVVDPLTVQVTMKRPWSSFDAHLYSSGRMGMMAQSQLDDAESCGRNMVGTGPFTLVDWRPNSSMQLARNPDYWRTDENGEQLPYLDELEFRPNPEVTQHVNSLTAGEEDVFHLSSNTASVNIEQLRGMADRGEINMAESDEFAEVGFLMLNVTKPPFDDPRAREAVALAVDREAVNEAMNNGIPTLANGPFAPGAQGYLEDTGFKTSDPEAAKALVEEYEAEKGELSFTITEGQDTNLQRQVDLIKQYFEDAGMTVQTTVLEQSALIQKAIEKGYDMVTFRNYPGFVPDTLYVWWYGNGNPVNFIGFNDPEVNDLLDRGRESTDPDERQQIYEDLNTELNKEHYFLWTSWTIWAMPSAPDVHGFVGARPPDGGGDYPGFAVGVDPALIWREQ